MDGTVPLLIEREKYLVDHAAFAHTNRRGIANPVRCVRSAFNGLARQIWRNKSLSVSTLTIVFVPFVRCHVVGALECFAPTKSEVTQIAGHTPGKTSARFDLEIALRTDDLKESRKFADRPTAEELRRCGVG